MGAVLIVRARYRFLPQSGQCTLDRGIKIAARNGRIGACLVPEVALNIPAILAEQRVGSYSGWP